MDAPAQVGAAAGGAVSDVLYELQPIRAEA